MIRQLSKDAGKGNTAKISVFISGDIYETSCPLITQDYFMESR